MSEQTQQLTTKNLFAKDEVKQKFQDMLGKRATSFITSVLQIVASNKLLINADPHSVYHSAAAAATLDLPLNNNLGFAAIVPYNESTKVTEVKDGKSIEVWKKRQVAQFQIMYKGFIQLAQRSGQYKTINATDVREGELIGKNLLTGELVFKWEQDEEKRDALPIIGFVSYFELLNGFSKTWYMSVGKLKKHAQKYSKTYQKGNGKWVDDFDAMALKTVLKLNISKFGPLSVDLQKAITFDQAVIKDADTMDVSYADGTGESETDEEENNITIDELKAQHDALKALYEPNFPVLGAKVNDKAKKIITNGQRIIDGNETGNFDKVAGEIREVAEEITTAVNEAKNQQ